MSGHPEKIALWFRYGPAEHLELWHGLPEVIGRLAESCEVHYFGMHGRSPVPERMAGLMKVHYVPLRVDRTRHRDKLIKTLLWYFCLPFIAMRCRFTGVKAVYIDETLPLATFIAQVFFGSRLAVTVADFFVDVYMEKSPILSPLRKLIKAIDFASWRRVPVIFTKTKSARNFLAAKGIDPSRVRPVYDPCDTALYHPVDKNEARQRFGFSSDEVVIVHHGILHPNKGNDLIIRALAEVMTELPAVRYLLVGSGPDEKRLHSLVEELGTGDIVQFTGWLPSPADVNIALNAADIGLVMRIGQESDDFHVTGALVHNMACGLPILAASLAGVAEVIQDEGSGLLFDPRDMDGFKTQLRKLAADPELRQQLGEKALDLSRQLFDLDHIAEQTVQPLLDMMPR